MDGMDADFLEANPFLALLEELENLDGKEVYKAKSTKSKDGSSVDIGEPQPSLTSLYDFFDKKSVGSAINNTVKSVTEERPSLYQIYLSLRDEAISTQRKNIEMTCAYQITGELLEGADCEFKPYNDSYFEIIPVNHSNHWYFAEYGTGIFATSASSFPNDDAWSKAGHVDKDYWWTSIGNIPYGLATAQLYHWIVSSNGQYVRVRPQKPKYFMRDTYWYMRQRVREELVKYGYLSR